jgi:hypothetical protein
VQLFVHFIKTASDFSGVSREGFAKCKICQAFQNGKFCSWDHPVSVKPGVVLYMIPNGYPPSIARK